MQIHVCLLYLPSGGQIGVESPVIVLPLLVVHFRHHWVAKENQHCVLSTIQPMLRNHATEFTGCIAVRIIKTMEPSSSSSSITRTWKMWISLYALLQKPEQQSCQYKPLQHKQCMRIFNAARHSDKIICLHSWYAAATRWRQCPQK